MVTPRERFLALAGKWFISEPALFSVYCTHDLEESGRIMCGIRSGQGRIEYNPDQVSLMSDPEFEQRMKLELIRLCLRHPYERQPVNCLHKALQMGSDMVISPAYHLPLLGLAKPKDMELPEGQHFEWYADAVNDVLHGQQKSAGGTASQLEGGQGSVPGSGDVGAEELKTLLENEYTGLWREDEERMEQMKEVLMGVQDWGTLPGQIVDVIQKALEGRIDYRKVLRAFQTSVISTNRTLTRMRPNRRFGFEAMGSKHNLSSKLLVAVDVSGSVSDRAIGKFFRIITNFFKYGVDAIDVIQFDAEVSPKVMDLKTGSREIKATKFEIQGRGGTSFQCVIDYLKEHNNYDGLIYFTDGYAPAPVIDFHTRAKLLWVTETEGEYNKHKHWMKKLGRACFIK